MSSTPAAARIPAPRPEDRAIRPRPRRARWAGLQVIGQGLLLLAAGLAPGCASAPADTATLEAEGLFVRHLRLRVVPSQTKAFEALMTRCVDLADSAGWSEDAEWLVYREPPGRYWIVWFADARDEFLVPRTNRPLASFVEHVGATSDRVTRRELADALTALDYEIEWDVVMRQSAAWSTVDEMTTATHPKAHLMLRTVMPGAEKAFADALALRTAFFAEHDYPLPIEGFVVLDGLPGHAIQVAFPLDWPSYHASDGFAPFVRALDQRAQDDYAARKAALMITMSRAEFYDASFLAEASFGAN